ncbi:hypothetical protein [Flavobacterium marginilacus]|uniref:hypothetical protein n=1 Tax=Flavobacterium marginilacus TaxID=3003256 RepID=UPI00248E7354|nr:hypothetical protein [Flavobacterium marginilacus]
MITIAICVLFLAFYTLYYTSKRASLTYTFSFEKWMRNHPASTKIIGITLLLVAYILWIATFGLGSGTLFFFIALMTIGSLIVILKPLKIIKFEILILLLSLIAILEIYYS